jgi:hypothetical protein
MKMAMEEERSHFFWGWHTPANLSKDMAVMIKAERIFPKFSMTACSLQTIEPNIQNPRIWKKYI